MKLACPSILSFFLVVTPSAQAPEGARLHCWKADMDAFAAHYAVEHPAPFRRLSKAEFEHRVDVLKRELPLLKNHEIAARWARVVADLGDEHTEVDFDAEFRARRLPIEIESYADGTFIVGASAPRQSLIGARLDRVEGVSLDALRQALKPYVPFTQEGWFNHIFDESFGTWPLLLDAVGIVKVKERWTLGGIRADGQPFSMEVRLVPQSAHMNWEWEGEESPAVLRDQHPRASYFFQVLTHEKALYFRLRKCDDSRHRPFKSVLAGALKTFQKSRLERLVVDLRGNTGGSEALVDRLVSALQKEPRLKGVGNLLVLTDGAVFSAAAVAAWRLRHEVGAFLVGEPCGASANHIGAVEDVRLPSGRIASYGTQVHIINQADPEDFSSPILPDLEVRPTHRDILKGIDPVLAAALGMPATH